MTTSTRIKTAAVATGLFIAGAVAGGLGLREDKQTPVVASSPAPVQVIHKRKVRTVRSKAAKARTTSPPAVAAPSVAPISSPAPTPVSSSASPGAGGGGGDEEGGFERDG